MTGDLNVEFDFEESGQRAYAAMLKVCTAKYDVLCVIQCMCLYTVLCDPKNYML